MTCLHKILVHCRIKSPLKCVTFCKLLIAIQYINQHVSFLLSVLWHTLSVRINWMPISIVNGALGNLFTKEHAAFQLLSKNLSKMFTLNVIANQKEYKLEAMRIKDRDFNILIMVYSHRKLLSLHNVHIRH